MSNTSTLDVALAILRLAFGLTFAAHGFSKIFLGGRISGTGRWFTSIGMRPGRLHAWLAALTEIGAGLLIAAGLLTALAGAAVVAVMVVAAWTVHRAHGFFIVKNGWEYNFILAVLGVFFAMAGAGTISLDEGLDLPVSIDGVAGLVVAAIGGLLAGTLQLLVFFRPPVVAEVAGV